MYQRAVMILCAVVTLGGCASGPTFAGRSGLEITENVALPPPSNIEPDEAVRPYRLGAFDKIQVDVFAQPDLSRAVQVDAGGTVSLPMIGEVSTTGLTPAGLAEIVETKLKEKHVRDPQVSVNLVEGVSQTVAVDGAVKEPGVYPVLGRMTLVRAIAGAKGVTEFAKLTDVVVFRSVGEQRMAGLYSLKAIRDGRYPDPEIFAGDVVVVGDSPGRRMFRDIASMGGLLTAPLVAIVR